MMVLQTIENLKWHSFTYVDASTGKSKNERGLISKCLFANKRKALQLKTKITPQLHQNHHKKLTKKMNIRKQYS